LKVLILSDIHANWSALTAVLDAESDWDVLFFLGDIVDYGPEPKSCLQYIKENADFYVRGNHDHAMAYGVDCGSRNDFHDLSVLTRQWHRTLLQEDDLDFLRCMPIIQNTIIDGKHFWLAHASPIGGLSRYLTPEQVVNDAANVEADIILVGHTHLPFIREAGGKIYCNPGSVGLARDILGNACYAVWQHESLILKRMSYPLEKTLALLDKAPLPSEVTTELRRVLT